MAIDRTVDTRAARKAGLPKTTGSLEPRPGRCGQRLSYTGKGPGNPPRYCMRYPTIGRKHCKVFGHGGAALAGQDSPSFKHGNHSKYAVLSPRLLAQFETTLKDAQLMDLKPDVALLDLLTWEAAGNLGGGASAAQWAEARQGLADGLVQLRKARSKPQVHVAMAALDAVAAILAAGADATGARDEVSRLAERRAKVVRTYQQLQVDTGDLIPAKHVGVALAIFAALMREFIEDDARRSEFSRRFVATMGARLRAATGSGVVDAEPGGVVGA